MIKFLERLFSKQTSDATVRDVAALLAPLAAPAVHVVKTGADSRSHFGGEPNLPEETSWPELNGKKLGFIARLSLAEIHKARAVEWLPTSGALLFFYDMEEQPWGFDPSDRGGSAVLHVPDLPNAISRPPEGEKGTSALPHRNIAFQRIDVTPSAQRESVDALELNEQESDLLYEFSEKAFLGEPLHQVSGFPNPVQGDHMELECQLVSNGLDCGNSSGYENPRAKALEPGAANWRLLFQMDSDEDLGIMWGDGGLIYYWVEEQAARNGDFQNTWLILQCH